MTIAWSIPLTTLPHRSRHNRSRRPPKTPNPLPFMIMKRPLLLSTFAASIVLFVFPVEVISAEESNASAAAQQTGAIFGRVKNSATGQYLNKARVTVKGTDIVTLTDEFGAYRIVNVPAGTKTLEVFY